MDDVEISENVEAAVVAGESVLAAITGYLVATGHPTEATLIGGIGTAIFVFWKAKVNKRKR